MPNYGGNCAYTLQGKEVGEFLHCRDRIRVEEQEPLTEFESKTYNMVLILFEHLPKMLLIVG